MSHIARNAVIRHQATLPSEPGAQITVEQAERELRETAFDAVDHIRFIFLASCMMLIGGFVLGSTRRDVKTHAP